MSDRKEELKNGSVIPIRRVPLTDQSQLPADYSATPGGTLFSTTPGGTRIIYDRNFLLQCRNSPLTKSPPANLTSIPGITKTTNTNAAEVPTGNENKEENKKPTDHGEGDAQFQMDM